MAIFVTKIKGVFSSHIYDVLNAWLSARDFTDGTIGDRWNRYWKSRIGQDGKSLADSIMGHLHGLGVAGRSIPEVMNGFYLAKGITGGTLSERERNFFSNTSNNYTL